MLDHEILEALSNNRPLPLMCKGTIVYFGTEAIGEWIEERIFIPAPSLAQSERADLLRDMITWKLQRERALRRLVRPAAAPQ